MEDTTIESGIDDSKDAEHDTKNTGVVQQMSTQCDHAQPVPTYRGAKYIVPDQAGEEDRDDNVGRTHSLTK